MSASLDYFSRGLTRAFERRKMQQQTNQHAQTVQKVDSDAISTTTSISDEQYKQTIVNKMIALIHKQRNQHND
ncbi:hypothetical protein [Pseudomonas sp. RT6P73]